MEIKLDRNDLIYKTGNRKKGKMNFKSFKQQDLSEDKYLNDDLSLDYALEQQVRLKDDIDIFKESTEPKESGKKVKKY